MPTEKDVGQNDSDHPTPIASGPRIELSAQAETLRGSYTNHVSIYHTRREFVFDFLVHLADNPPQLVSRIVTSPGQAKAIAGTLSGSIRAFERSVGEIEPDGTAKDLRVNSAELRLLASLVAERQSLTLGEYTGRRYDRAKRNLISKKLIERRGRRYNLTTAGFQVFRRHVESMVGEVGT